MQSNIHQKITQLDNQVVLGIVAEGSKVLDLGCGEGELLWLLKTRRQAKVQGIELNEQAIYKCVEKGVSVYHGDVESALPEYPDKAFDYVILNQSMQETRNVDVVIHQALRVGRQVIIGFPNFAHYRGRFRLFFQGKGPVTPELPYFWYDTPNLHFLSITDFTDYCEKKQITISQRFYLGRRRLMHVWPNLRARNGLFVLEKDTGV